MYKEINFIPLIYNEIKVHGSMIDAITDSRYFPKYLLKAKSPSEFLNDTMYILHEWNGSVSVIKEHFIPLKKLEKCIS